MVAPVKKESKKMSLNLFVDYIENCKQYGKEPSWEGLIEYKTMYNNKEEKEHPYVKNKKIVNGMIKNEFEHIHKCSELDFTKTNIDYKQINAMTELIRKALIKKTNPEQKRLIEELENSISNEWIELCRFYFKEGVRSGLTNLKFLTLIDDIEYII